MTVARIYPGAVRVSTPAPTTLSLFDLPPLEVWRDCVVRGQSFPAYQVSSFGHVRRVCPGPRAGKLGRGSGKVGYILQPCLGVHGYPQVTLSRDNKRLTIPLHHVVAESFLGPRPEKYHINHKDGNKQNAAIDNLEYCTARENQQHAVRIGLVPSENGKRIGIRGEAHPRAKLTDEKVRSIRQLLREEELNLSDIGRRFGVSSDLIYNIRDGKTWRHVR